MVPQLELHAVPTLAVVLLQTPLHSVTPHAELQGCWYPLAQHAPALHPPLAHAWDPIL
jgi:hypothetical protein